MEATIGMLTQLGYHLNVAIDSREYEHVTVVEVMRSIEQGDVFKYLETTAPELEVALQCFTKEARTELAAEWREMLGDVETIHNGFALLIAYILVGVDNRSRELDLLKGAIVPGGIA